MNAIIYTSHTIPYFVRTKKEYSVSITAKNNGTTIWSDEAGFRLGECNSAGTLYTGATPWGAGRLRLSANIKILPGETGVFSGTIIAPSDNKLTECLWRALEEGKEVFGDIYGISPGVMIAEVSSYKLTPPRIRGGDGCQILNTGPYKMGPYSNEVELHCYEWVPSRALELFGSAIWMGVSPLEAQADIDAVLLTASGTVLGAFPQDFYAHFSAPHLPHTPLPGVIVEAGESVLLAYFAKPIVDSVGPNWASHHSVFLWYKEVAELKMVRAEQEIVELPYPVKCLLESRNVR